MKDDSTKGPRPTVRWDIGATDRMLFSKRTCLTASLRHDGTQQPVTEGIAIRLTEVPPTQVLETCRLSPPIFVTMLPERQAVMSEASLPA
jgi:hypothetical protein